jgi:hypothetical protein
LLAAAISRLGYHLRCRVTAYRRLDDAVGQTDTGSEVLADVWAGETGRHRLVRLFRHGSRFGDAGSADDRKDPTRVFRSAKPIKVSPTGFWVSRKVVRKIIRLQATEYRYERSRQPLPRIDPWGDQLDELLL